MKEIIRVSKQGFGYTVHIKGDLFGIACSEDEMMTIISKEVIKGILENYSVEIIRDFEHDKTIDEVWEDVINEK